MQEGLPPILRRKKKKSTHEINALTKNNHVPYSSKLSLPPPYPQEAGKRTPTTHFFFFFFFVSSATDWQLLRIPRNS
jgi:hypothetical protein